MLCFQRMTAGNAPKRQQAVPGCPAGPAQPNGGRTLMGGGVGKPYAAVVHATWGNEVAGTYPSQGGGKGPRRKLIGRDGLGQAAKLQPAAHLGLSLPPPASQCPANGPSKQKIGGWEERPSRQGSSCQQPQPARCRRPAQATHHWTHSTPLAAKSDGGRDVSLLRTLSCPVLSVLQLLLHRAAAPSLSVPNCAHIPATGF